MSKRLLICEEINNNNKFDYENFMTPLLSDYTKNFIEISFLKLLYIDNYINSLDDDTKIKIFNDLDKYIKNNDEYIFLKSNIKNVYGTFCNNDKINLLLFVPSIVFELLILGMDINILPKEIKDEIIKIKNTKSARK